MPTTTATITEKDLLALENRYWRAIEEKDVEAALDLTDFPCLVSGATGVGLIDEEKFIKIMKGATYTLHAFELTDAQVRFLQDDVALLAYKVHEDLTVEGKKVSIDAADASTWVRRDGRWRCALHTESLQGDPYGRDRKAR